MPFFQGATNFEVNNPTFNDITGNYYATNNSQYTNIQDSFNTHRTNYVNSGNDSSRTYGASRPKQRQSKSAGDALGNVSQGYAPRGRGPQSAPPASMGSQPLFDNSWMQNLPQPPPGQPVPSPNSAFADILQHQTNRPQPDENQGNDGQDAGQEAFSDMSNRKKKKKKKQTQLADLGEDDFRDQGVPSLGEEIANEIRNDLKNGLQPSVGGTVTNTNSFNTTTTNHQNTSNNYSTNITASGSGPIQLPPIPMRNPHAPVQPPPPAMAAPPQQPPQGQVPPRPTAHPVQNNQGQPPPQNFQPPLQHNQGQPQQGQQQPQSMPQPAPLQNQSPIHQEPQSYVSEPQGVGMPTPQHFANSANDAGNVPGVPSMADTVNHFLGNSPASAEQKKKKKNWFKKLFSKKKKKGTDAGLKLEAPSAVADAIGA